MIKSKLQELEKWLIQNDFEGYDPYDALNSKIQILKKNKSVRILFSYLFKFSPLNLRKPFKVQKTIDNQGLSLILETIIQYNNVNFSNNNYDKYIKYIIEKSLIKKYGYHCWNGHNYWIQTTREYQSPDMPGIVGTEACANMLFEYYKLFPSVQLKEIIISVKEFFLDILYCESNGEYFFRYKPHSPKSEFIYNASIIAALFIIRINNYFNLKAGTENAVNAVKSVLNKQKKSGVWNYGLTLGVAKEKQQIDFHQGFILEALREYYNYYNSAKIFNQYKNGLDFYLNHQFDDVGQSFYRLPKKYPIDIHNQAQGIITFSKAAVYDEKYMNFADKIVEWTVKNMQDKDGYFYYQKYRLFKNKIPYIRWSQAWMFKALTTYLLVKNQK